MKYIGMKSQEKTSDLLNIDNLYHITLHQKTAEQFPWMEFFNQMAFFKWSWANNGPKVKKVATDVGRYVRAWNDPLNFAVSKQNIGMWNPWVWKFGLYVWVGEVGGYGNWMLVLTLLENHWIHLRQNW